VPFGPNWAVTGQQRPEKRLGLSPCQPNGWGFPLVSRRGLLDIGGLVGIRHRRVGVLGRTSVLGVHVGRSIHRRRMRRNDLRNLRWLLERRRGRVLLGLALLEHPELTRLSASI